MGSATQPASCLHVFASPADGCYINIRPQNSQTFASPSTDAKVCSLTNLAHDCLYIACQARHAVDQPVKRSTSLASPPRGETQRQRRQSGEVEYVAAVEVRPRDMHPSIVCPVVCPSSSGPIRRPQRTPARIRLRMRDACLNPARTGVRSAAGGRGTPCSWSPRGGSATCAQPRPRRWGERMSQGRKRRD